jgi:hypothetical protein
MSILQFNAQGSNFGVALLTDNVTSVSISNGVRGQSFSILFMQDGAGGHTVAVGGGNVSGLIPPATAANAVTVETFVYDDTSNMFYSNIPAGAGAVSSVFGRTGVVVAQAGDYTVGEVTDANIIAIPSFAPGVGSNNQKLLRVAMVQNLDFPINAPNSVAVASAAATGSTTFTLKKNGTSFATVNFAISSATGIWTQAADATFGPGDLLEIDGPATADATLADVGITLAGTKS